MLTGNYPRLHWMRRIWGALPSPPRCKLCNAPFRGPSDVLTRAIAYGPSPLNRRLWTTMRRTRSQPRGAFSSGPAMTAPSRGFRPAPECIPAGRSCGRRTHGGRVGFPGLGQGGEGSSKPPPTPRVWWVLDPLGFRRSDVRFLGKRLRLRRRHARFFPRHGVRLPGLWLWAFALRIWRIGRHWTPFEVEVSVARRRGSRSMRRPRRRRR